PGWDRVRAISARRGAPPPFPEPVACNRIETERHTRPPNPPTRPHGWNPVSRPAGRPPTPFAKSLRSAGPADTARADTGCGYRLGRWLKATPRSPAADASRGATAIRYPAARSGWQAQQPRPEAEIRAAWPLTVAPAVLPPATELPLQ